MKAVLIKLVSFSTILFLSIPVLGQSSWKLAKDQDGIRVYLKDSRSNFKSIKVECTLDGNYEKLISIINNVQTYKDWVYHNKTATLLKRIGPAEFYYYTETYLPWPMDNRDAVMHTRIIRDSLNRFLKISAVAAPNYIAQKSGKVRIVRSDINWHVTIPAPNKIRIIYTFETDPGGNVPPWLVNSFADKGPHESFKKLALMLKRAK